MTTPPDTQPDASQIAQEIRAGLEGVTPGPWEFCIWADDSYGLVACEIDNGTRGRPASVMIGLAPAETIPAADFEHIARCSPDRIAILLNAFDAQTREIAELREALKPFAEKTAVHFVEGGLFSNASDGLALMWMSATEQVDQFTVGDLRRARSVLRAKENPNG